MNNRGRADLLEPVPASTKLDAVEAVLTQQLGDLGRLSVLTVGLGARRPAAVQLSERAVELELLLGEDSEFDKVCAALGFGNKGAEVPLAVFEGALVNLLDGAANFAGFGWFDFGEE